LQERKTHAKDLEGLKRNKSPNELVKHIAVDPSLEVRFPYEPKKNISCCLQLTNRTAASFIAFNINTGINKYLAQPNKGILAPCSKCYITITLLAQEEAPPNMQCHDVLVLQSKKVNEHFTSEEIIQDLFVQASIVDEVILPIVYISQPLSQ
jgi:hypothetical protein